MAFIEACLRSQASGPSPVRPAYRQCGCESEGPVTSPSGPRTPTRPALDTGDVLATRYRLLRCVSDDTGPTTVWQASDEVLARRVAVKLLPASGRAGAAAAKPFLEAAGRASSLSHPGLARVYDAAIEERPAERGTRTVDVAYVISEWVEGRTLAEILLTDGPLEVAEGLGWRLPQFVAAVGSSLQSGKLGAYAWVLMIGVVLVLGLFPFR